ncbi:MAG: type II toxin-antitoxin system RelE/ParE family toxin [Proteobacteria bacterium]|nr:type II toxin-antitoxin system RelE/ParE family toxin [Pseudomonadota bacterium]MBU1388736.1 type II toxin-antitoxin system RelE/ParE family toxin [Pseudomonadota bacterium]MBU1543077.1 type II toxin-antitoxin system RelE/ParE family toxin [Pseudomonadota bacterium]MBU2429878.1 type II toxin-antitoxin system RelE/ParE family toxin [Pseudomonadota bacterium]MBU2481819.1 type II toxin-antitoxin system RelE/ParE family toxin [Pseudomonadota bacterium]
MILDFKKSFVKDLKKFKTDKPFLERVRQVIQQVEAAQDIHSIHNLKKLKAQGNHYRIRMGDYRLGLVIENNTICFVRCLHRSDVYRYFP